MKIIQFTFPTYVYISSTITIILSAVVNGIVAYLMYDGKADEYGVWTFPNTIFGDLLVTTIIEIFISYFLMFQMLVRDYIIGQPIVIVGIEHSVVRSKIHPKWFNWALNQYNIWCDSALMNWLFKTKIHRDQQNSSIVGYTIDTHPFPDKLPIEDVVQSSCFFHYGYSFKSSANWSDKTTKSDDDDQTGSNQYRIGHNRIKSLLFYKNGVELSCWQRFYLSLAPVPILIGFFIFFIVIPLSGLLSIKSEGSWTTTDIVLLKAIYGGVLAIPMVYFILVGAILEIGILLRVIE